MKVYLSFIRQAFHNTAIYRVQFWLQLVSGILFMYASYWLWSTLAAQNPQAIGASREQIITYGLLATAGEMILGGEGPHWYIANQIRTGAIDTDLMKPMDFHLYMLARNYGDTIFRLTVLGAPALVLAVPFFGLRPPVSFSAGLVFAVSFLLGHLTLFSLNFLLGMLAMVTLNISNITWAYNAIVRFLSGQIAPLWLFGGVVAAVAHALPFRSIYFIPLSIYVGTLEGGALHEALLFQAVWVILLIALGRFAWSRVHTRLVVQGG
jgi:ABC-2 type transport system permease protein